MAVPVDLGVSPPPPVRRALGLARDHVRSAVLAARQPHAFDDVERYCMFVGYPRSGHTIIGSLLNAHPEVVIGHELDALRLLPARFTRRQIFALLLDADRRFEARGRVSTGAYDYRVPGQWQGRYACLRVIGDKKGGASAERIERRPGLVDELRARTGLPLRCINVVRHPLDNVTTIARRDRLSIGAALDYYDALNRGVAAARARCGTEEWFALSHEDFVAAPARALADLFGFLGVEPHAEVVDAAAAIVRDRPHRSRRLDEWDAPALRRLASMAESHDHLHRYVDDLGEAARSSG